MNIFLASKIMNIGKPRLDQTQGGRHWVFVSLLGLGLLVFLNSEVRAQGLALSCGENGVLRDLRPYSKPQPPVKQIRKQYNVAIGHSVQCRRSDRCEQESKTIFELGRDLVNSLRKLLSSASDLEDQNQLKKRVSDLESSCAPCGEEPEEVEENQEQENEPTIAWTRRPPTEKLQISYPWKGPNRQKAGQYDRRALMATVMHAIHTGTDPYLALAVVAQENPPTNMDRFSPYSLQRGVIPVDQTGAYEQLDCFAQERGTDRFPTVSEDEVASHRKIYTDYLSLRDQYQKLVKQDQWFRLYDEVTQKIGILKEQIAFISKPKPQKKFDFSIDGIKRVLVHHPSLAKYKEELALEQQRLNRLLVDSGAQSNLKVIRAFQKAESDLTQFRMSLVQKKGAKSRQALEELSCSVDRRNCFGFTAPQKNIPKADLSFLVADRGQLPLETTLCSSSNRVDVGQGPEFLVGFKKDRCCVNVLAPRSLSGLNIHTKTWIGANYLKDHIQSCIASQRGSLTYCLQRYNGTGCFGCTESSSNDCFNGIVMEDRPVYGARVADLMLNSFMSDPEIRQIVEDVARREKKSPVSVFCYGHNESSFMVLNDQFLAEQKKYLLEGSKHPYKMKISGGAVLRPAKTPKERQVYLEREKRRANACQFLFK